MKLLATILLAAVALSVTARDTSTRAMAEGLMRRNPPALQYDPSMPADSFAAWRAEMGEAMTRLMRHPEAPAAEPVKVGEARRDGYRIERWESYPLEDAVVGYYVLIPDGVDGSNPAPAAICIPGFGQTKELLAGERAGNYTLEGEADSVVRQAAMALHFVREGLVAVAVDNPSCGELSDGGYADYVASSRFLLEAGWSWLGLASWQDRVILEWMKGRPEIRPDRIIASGFSLGTEPMMVLGLMDPTIYAFVYNDFLCRTRERALTMNARAENGSRDYPNNIEHLIPEFLMTFDFPDIVCAFAPRPTICTEGGMDRDFDIIAGAYEKAGARDAFEYHHYAKYADPSTRQPLEAMPEGVTRDEFFRLANVDPPHHYFKTEHILPWLRRLLAE